MDDRLAHLVAKVGKPSLLHRLPRSGVRLQYALRTRGVKIALAWQGGCHLAHATAQIEQQRLALVRDVVGTKVSLRTLIELQHSQDRLEHLQGQARELHALLDGAEGSR